MPTSTRMRAALLFVLFVALLGFQSGCNTDVQSESAAVPPANDTSSAPPVERNAHAVPEFALQDLEGRTVHLSDFAGKAVFLNFWATWCPPCKAELPDLVEVQKQYGGDDFVIVGISLDQAGPGKVQQFVQNAGLNYPILMGNEGVVADYGGFQGIPTSFLLNARHEAVRQYTGMITKAQLVHDLQDVLKQST
jgi:thiol-disulfide isomerase/thioredoxin